jgi:hypothetical protein
VIHALLDLHRAKNATKVLIVDSSGRSEGILIGLESASFFFDGDEFVELVDERGVGTGAGAGNGGG